MKKILATSITLNYLEIARPYLTTIEYNSTFDENILITLDFKAENKSFKNIKTSFLSSDKVQNMNNNRCIQQGEFIKSDLFESFSDTDIITFTDADIILQRGLSLEEEKLISSIKDDEILVQYNENEQDSLYKEFFRLSPTKRIEDIEKITGDLKNYKCFNTGVVVANLATWKKILNYYNQYYSSFENTFGHYAKQQWILSYIFNIHFKVKILDFSFHSHFHYDYYKNLIHFNNSISMYKDTKVLFSHFCMENDLPRNKNGFLEQQKRFITKHIKDNT